MAPCGKGAGLFFFSELSGNPGNGVRRNVLAKLSKNTDPFSGWFVFIFHLPILSGIGGQPLSLKSSFYGTAVNYLNYFHKNISNQNLDLTRKGAQSFAAEFLFRAGQA